MHLPITLQHEGYGSFKMPTDWAQFWSWRNGTKEKTMRNIDEKLTNKPSPEPTFDSLSAGQVVYYVHSLGKSSFLTKYQLASSPYISKYTQMHFIDAWYLREGEESSSGTPSDFSLDDCNVIPNSYNNHKLFYTKEKAERYLENCIKGVV